MGLGDFVKKLVAPSKFGRGVSPDETEIDFYRRREYKDRLKKILRYYRAKQDHEAFASQNKVIQGNKEEHKFTLFNGGFLK